MSSIDDEFGTCAVNGCSSHASVRYFLSVTNEPSFTLEVCSMHRPRADMLASVCEAASALVDAAIDIAETGVPA